MSLNRKPGIGHVKTDAQLAAQQKNADTGAWHWHIWKKGSSKNDKNVWGGSFVDLRTALDWVKAQRGKNWVVNNVPPSSARRVVPPSTITDTVEVETVSAPRSVPRKVTPPRPVVSPAEAKATATLRKSAEKRLEQHKTDEAADVASGKIENVE